MTQAAPLTTDVPPASAGRVGVWGAVSLSLLVFSGQLKATVLFNWLPVDLTILTAAIVALSVARSRIKGGPASGYVFLPILIWVMFLIPLVYSPASLDPSKVATLFTVTLLLGVAPFYVLRTEVQRRAFLWAAVILGALTVAIVLITGSTVEGFESRFVIEGSDTIGTARVAGAGAIVALIFAVAKGRRALQRVMLVGVGGALILLAFTTGSRGPVLAAAVALAVSTLFSPAFKKYRGRVIVVFAVIAGGVFALAQSQSSDGFDRILNFFVSEDASTQARSTLTSQAWQTIQENPFGIGWGNFNASNGLFQYPHNLFLEVPMEGGWIAGIVLIALIVAAGVRFLLVPQDATQVAMFGLLIFATINASVSSDINGNRLLWVAVFAAFAVAVERKEPRQSAAYLAKNRRTAYPAQSTPATMIPNKP